MNRMLVFAAVLALMGLSLGACGGANGPPIDPSATVATASRPPKSFSSGSPLILTPRASSTAATIYTDPQGRFAFSVPDGYQQSANPSLPGVVVQVTFMSRTVSAAFIVTSQSVEQGMTLDEKTAAVIAATSQIPGYTALTDQPIATTVAGQPARRFEFIDTENGGHRYHNVAFTMLWGGELYTMTIEIEEKDFAASIAQATPFIDTFMFLA